MQLVFSHFTSSNESWHREAVEVYLKKIRPFQAIEVHEFKNKKNQRESSEIKKKLEAEMLLDYLKPGDWLVLFDEKATTLDSKQMSQKMNQWLLSGKKRIVFVIGGAYGFTEEIKKRADFRISLSAMTMNHLVAQVVALEQIYRSFAILKNLPYHNE